MSLIKPGEIKTFLIILIVSAVVTASAVSIYLLLSTPPQPSGLPTIINNPFSSLHSAKVEDRLLLSDFLIPGSGGELAERGWKFYREPLKKWSDEELLRFWISPKEFDLQELPEKNDKMIERLLEGVP